MPRPNRAGDIVAYLEDRRGAGMRSDLMEAVSRAALRSAEECGWVTNLGNGSYVLTRLATPPLGDANACRSWTNPDPSPQPAESDHITALLAFARGRRAVLSHRSAAIAQRWMVLEPPTCVELTYPKGRPRPAATSVPVAVRRTSLTGEELRVNCTSPLRTVIDCARDLPPAEALAIADSALRTEAIGPLEMRTAAECYRGRRAERVRRILTNADGAAANPFESALRWILLGVGGVEFQAQARVQDPALGLHATVDLGVPHLRLACEADSYEFHGGRDNFYLDRRRYALLNAAGWIVLTFTLRQVREEPAWIREVVEVVVGSRRAHIDAESDATRWRRLQRKRVRSRSARATAAAGRRRDAAT